MRLSAASRSEESAEDQVFSPDAVVTVAQTARGHGMMEIMWILAALLPFLTKVISDVEGLNLYTFCFFFC